MDYLILLEQLFHTLKRNDLADYLARRKLWFLDGQPASMHHFFKQSLQALG